MIVCVWLFSVCYFLLSLQTEAHAQRADKLRAEAEAVTVRSCYCECDLHTVLNVVTLLSTW